MYASGRNASLDDFLQFVKMVMYVTYRSCIKACLKQIGLWVSSYHVTALEKCFDAPGALMQVLHQGEKSTSLNAMYEG